MNIHHLELFFYVARHGGIAEAVRNMPYGIQQPAVSAQVIQLEESLGLTLFHRRPFALTPQGEKLFRFIEPFFSGIDRISDELRGDSSGHIRFGASEIVLRDHLPEMVQSVRKTFPKFRLSLREDYHPNLLQGVQSQEIDLAVTILEGKPPAGIQCVPLLEASLVLLVPKSSKLKAAAELWERDRIEDPLVCLPNNESISRNFQAGLTKLHVDWFPAIEVSTIALLETYVANGYGIGVSIDVPQIKRNPGTRAIPLPGFTPVLIGALWQGKTTPLMDAFLGEIKARAKFILDQRPPTLAG